LQGGFALQTHLWRERLSLTLKSYCSSASNRVNEHKLVLYSREGCHLCEDMHEQLNELAQSLNFSFVVIDIDETSELREQYNDAVPLLLAGDREICRHFLDLKSLQAAIGNPHPV